ncbi:MAG: PD-(D/E)XK nuclease family protein, partial [Pseudomonadota bacterium]|nr:PD-(D/E)XK nuclease family protein [Pseudomonadota bacterium]
KYLGSAVRRMEMRVLRGPPPPAGPDGLRDALVAADARDDLTGLADDLKDCVQPLIDLASEGSAKLVRWIEAHMALAERAATRPGESGEERLWRREEGVAAAGFIAELIETGRDMPEMDIAGYVSLLGVLMSQVPVRPRFGLHPRLHIWGLLEARLQRADVMILGGLNEGVWPTEPGGDPWMSRPMRDKFGLPPADQTIGFASHDFVQAAMAKTVILTRSERVDGTPTVPSRWLLRLETVLGARKLPARPEPDMPWRDLARALDMPDSDKLASRRPEPRPPLAARPRQLSVTRIAEWLNDPYRIYARHILGLRPLDPVDMPLGPSQFGLMVHKALEMFLRDHPGDLPFDSYTRLIKAGEKAFGVHLGNPDIAAFWWPRFERIAEWFLEMEEKRREYGCKPLAQEVRGEMSIDAPAGQFVLTAIADRIDQTVDGLEIIDYKTGAPPTEPQMRDSRAPQLPLEALIARFGGFDDIDASKVARLTHWRLTGVGEVGKEKTVTRDMKTLIDETEAGLAGLVARFDDPATAYAPEPTGKMRFNDYAQLSRLAEWTVPGEDSDDKD